MLVTDTDGAGRDETVLRTLFDFFKFTFSAPDSFRPDSAEEQFLHDYARRFLAHRRAISILAVAYWSAFMAWDIARLDMSSSPR